MDWQQVLSLMLVALTASLLARSEYRRRKRARNSVCGVDCGCSSRSTHDIHNGRNIHA